MAGSTLVWPRWPLDSSVKIQPSPVLWLDLVEKNNSFMSDVIMMIDSQSAQTYSIYQQWSRGWWGFSILLTKAGKMLIPDLNSLFRWFLNASVPKTVRLLVALKTQEISCKIKKHFHFKFCIIKQLSSSAVRLSQMNKLTIHKASCSMCTHRHTPTAHTHDLIYSIQNILWEKCLNCKLCMCVLGGG